MSTADEQEQKLDAILDRTLRTDVPSDVERRLLERLPSLVNHDDSGTVARTNVTRTQGRDPRRRRRMAMAVAAIGVLAVTVSAVALRRPAMEQWWLWKLASDVDSERRNAAERLGEMGSKRAVPLLVALLRDEMPELPSESETLQTRGTPVGWGWPPGTQATHSSEVLRWNWHGAKLPYPADALIEIGAPSIRALDALLDESEIPTRLVAATILSRIGRPAETSLLRRLQDGDSMVRELAAAALGVRGRVIDHEGHPVVGAEVVLNADRRVQVRNGVRFLTRPQQQQRLELRPQIVIQTNAISESWFLPAQTNVVRTDAEGRFVLHGARLKGNGLLVLSTTVRVWSEAVSERRTDLNVRLPQPGTVALRYAIDGGEAEANVSLELETDRTQTWDVFSCVERHTIPNGGEIVLRDVAPGRYIVSRRRQLSLNGSTITFTLEPETLEVSAGSAKVVELTRSVGNPIVGRLTGLPTKLVEVGIIIEKKLPPDVKPRENRPYIVDALKANADGGFRTPTLSPGSYWVRASTYPRSQQRRSTRQRLVSVPDYSGMALVTVTATHAPPARRDSRRGPLTQHHP